MRDAITVLICSCVAIAAGAAGGIRGGFTHPAETTNRRETQTPSATRTHSGAARTVREIRPIVTNLSAPPGAWIRVELALIASGEANPKLDQQISEFVSDTTDFLRSMTSQQLEGPSGLRRLREDLLERARFRIGMAVEAVLIQTLVVQ